MKPNDPAKLEERFWSLTMPEPMSGCFLWMAGADSDGYGWFYIGTQNGKQISCAAHRFSWELQNGPIPKSKHILHKCDTPSCVNPDHLYLGTNSDNQLDAHARSRHPSRKGVLHPLVKLTDGNVVEIRGSPGKGVDLAKQFRVSPATICNIRKRKTWKHLEE
jgi:hypothetical protein